MKRRLLNLLTALTLLLCVAAVAKWVGARRHVAAAMWTMGSHTLYDVQVEGDCARGVMVRDWPAKERPGLAWYAPRDTWAADPAAEPLQIHMLSVRRSDWARLGMTGQNGVGYTHVTPDGTVRRRRQSESFDEDKRTGMMPYVLVEVPLAAVVAVLASPSLLLLAFRWRERTVRWKRGRAGLCPRCAYDLRATPGRCPECGTEAAPPPRPTDGGAGR